MTWSRPCNAKGGTQNLDISAKSRPARPASVCQSESKIYYGVTRVPLGILRNNMAYYEVYYRFSGLEFEVVGVGGLCILSDGFLGLVRIEEIRHVILLSFPAADIHRRAYLGGSHDP